MPQLIILLFVMLFPSLSLAASFDCSRASTNLETLICGDPQISKSDGDLRVSYFRALKEASNPGFIKQRQHEWQVNVRDRCKDVACLKNAYSSRIAQLAADMNIKSQDQTLALATPSAAVQRDNSSLPPLSPEELKAVAEEIRGIAGTSVQLRESLGLEESFIVREATPARIDRLLQMPEFLQLRKWDREVALIFAGQGSLLTFEKPSDILANVSAWFPSEVAAARSEKENRFFGHVGLMGPYPNWQDEPAAFLTLWRCMPEKAWLKPTQNFFMRRLKDSGSDMFMAIGDRQSGQFNFGQCVRERNNSITAVTYEEFPVIEKERREIGNRVAPVLQRKFARFLSSNRCKGTGPDDCVLILLLWANLSPEDPELARAIQDLEHEVSPDSPLPELQKPLNQYEAREQEGEARFDEALRKMAFMRAKQLSVVNAENAWPPQALQKMLHQISGLLHMITAANNFRWNYYNLDYYDEHYYNRGDGYYGYAPSLETGQSPRMQAAVLKELENLANNDSCGTLEVWLKLGGQKLRSTFALRHLIDQPPLRCINPEWEWLKLGHSEEARDLRNQYLGLLGHIESGAIYEMLLSRFTDNGNSCFSEAAQEWQRDVCKTWISEPQTVPFTLKYSQLTLSKENQFHPTPLQLPAASAAGAPDISSWLAKLVQGMNSEAQNRMQTLIADLQRRKGSVHAATWWSKSGQGKSLVELQLYINDQPSNPVWPFTGSRILLIFDAETLTIVGVPQRFLRENDHGEIVHVSDLDEDGNLEVWWAESFRTCRGDGTDLDREIDCTAKMADMGEVKGDSLSFFSNTPKTNKQPDLVVALKSPEGLTATAMPANERTRYDDRPCNAALIAQALKSQVPIDFGGGELNGGRGDVIGLVCKPHPLHAEQTIVALFHDLKDKQGEYVENRKGFVLAVIDAKQGKIHSLYRDTVEEDASTRIDEHSLNIDTARYNLAPGVRAFGVRMNIGYSPRCAEGRESNYLTLFIEEGKRLKPIIKNFPMSSWSITEGSNNCGDGNASYTMDNVELTLAVSSTSTQGWRDLEVTAHHRIETSGAAADSPTKMQMKEQVLGKFRANRKTLWLDKQPTPPSTAR